MIRANTRTANRFRSILLVAAVGLALAGCGNDDSAGQPGPTTQPTTQTTPTSSPSAPSTPSTPPSSATNPTTEQPGSDGKGRCSADVLSGEVRMGDAAAGNRYAKLVVTNDGSTACTLYGYGGFQLVDAAGKQLPTSTKRDEAPEPSLVRLAPGASAAKTLHWGVVPTGNEPGTGPCQPEPGGATVIPPDETEPFTVDWSFGPVCGGGTIHDSAYYAL